MPVFLQNGRKPAIWISFLKVMIFQNCISLYVWSIGSIGLHLCSDQLELHLLLTTTVLGASGKSENCDDFWLGWLIDLVIGQHDAYIPEKWLQTAIWTEIFKESAQLHYLTFY